MKQIARRFTGRRVFLRKANMILPAAEGDNCALIEGLGPSQALALGTLRADLPDKVEISTRNRLNGVERPDLIARTGAAPSRSFQPSHMFPD